MVVTGTGTEIGKTWVSCALLRLARSRGLAVAARKPLQSFSPGDRHTDAGLLAGASGEDDSVVCPPGGSFAAPMAPPMAAAALGSGVPTTASLVGSLSGSWPATGCDLALVEGAGGVASPLAADGTTADLARALGPDRVVVVADPALGVIHSTRLCVGAVAPLPVVVHLNRFDPVDDLHRRNAAWLADEDGLTVTTTVEDLLGRLLPS